MKPKLARIVITLVGVIIALSALDRALARVESAEMQSAAERSYAAGSRLLAAGKPAEAVELLRDAHAVERENPTYELALITALMDSGRTTDAKALMDDMLDREPNDGEVDLIAARLATREGKPVDADAYYHRAIFGEWPQNADAHRIDARMELIDQLMKQGRKQQLVAELISLDAEPKADAKIKKRLAILFLDADSPARAAGVYRDMISSNPDDAAAYEGLGEAELEDGQYSAARSAFLQASFHDPKNASIRLHLQTLNTVIGLDPTLRQLTSEEKYARSIRILDMARAELAACAPGNSLIAQAEGTVSGETPIHVKNEDAEKVLAQAEMVWQAKNDVCRSEPAEEHAEEHEDALKLLMKKLAS